MSEIDSIDRILAIEALRALFPFFDDVEHEIQKLGGYPPQSFWANRLDLTFSFRLTELVDEAAHYLKKVDRSHEAEKLQVLGNDVFYKAFEHWDILARSPNELDEIEARLDEYEQSSFQTKLNTLEAQARNHLTLIRERFQPIRAYVDRLTKLLNASGSSSEVPPPEVEGEEGPSESVSNLPANEVETNEDARKKQARGRATRPATVNERMLGEITKNPEAMGWNSTQWQKHLKCGRSTVVETAAWKGLESARLKARAEKMKDRWRKDKDEPPSS